MANEWILLVVPIACVLGMGILSFIYWLVQLGEGCEDEDKEDYKD